MVRRLLRAACRLVVASLWAIGGAEVHSCINIYNFWIQFCDKFLPLKSDLHKTTQQIDGTISFVIFPKCFVIFSKCCLRVPFVACWTAMDSPKKSEQPCIYRKAAPELCKYTTFFYEIQIADFCVNISRTACTQSSVKGFFIHIKYKIASDMRSCSLPQTICIFFR